MQLESVDSLKKSLTLYSVISWILLWIKLESEQNTEQSSEIILQKYEWQTLFCVVNKTTNLPNNPTSLKETVLMLAKLGGFLGRKSDGYPGLKVIWRGLMRLYDICQGVLINQLPNNCH